MHLRKLPPLVVASILLLAVQGWAPPPGGAEVAEPGGEGVHFSLAPAPDGSEITWTSSPGAGDEAGEGAGEVGPFGVAWDLTALDRSAYRSDLVRIDVRSVAGPGRLTVSTEAAYGRRATVIDRASPSADGDPASMVLQLGRSTAQEWSFDRPGTHVVELRATIPLATGGVAEATATHVFGPGDLSADEASSPPESPAVASSGGSTVARGAGEGEATRAPRAGPRRVITEGHVDIGPRIVDGHWRVQVKDDTVTPYVWRDLSDVVLHAVDASRIEVPDRPAYAFLGAPGTPYHVLPQTQQPGIVWPGWNSQDPSVIAAVPGSVTWRLRGVDGPGRFALFVTDSFGDIEVYFDTNDSMPQDLAIPRNSHVHGSWAFGAPGVYRLQVEMRATLANGNPVTDTRTLAIAVGDATDPSQVGPDDPGSPGQPVPLGLGDDGPSVSITTDLEPEGGDGGGGNGGGGSGGGGSGGSGGGSLAQTGTTILRLAPWAVLLIAIGTSLHLTTRRKLVRNENHS